MAAKSFFCPECKQWINRLPDETMRGTRIEHAKMHTAVESLFADPELMALDAELDYFYKSEH